MKKLTLVLCCTCLLSGGALSLSLVNYKRNFDEERDFRAKLLHTTRQCIDYNLQDEKKEELFDLLEQIEKSGCVTEQGSDDLRVKYVFSQGCIEHVLACSQALGDVTDLIGMIHTPTPATPLCTRTDPLDQTLLDESIRYDLNKLLTVRSRAQIVREYLNKGGTLYAVYPEGGLEKRSLEQQAVYKEELEHHPDRLFDWVLQTNELHPDMIGATYFFKSRSDGIYVFSIKARQANDIQKNAEWGLWLDKVESPEIKKRINSLFSYFNTCNGPAQSDFF